jgi:hypothetical protein
MRWETNKVVEVLRATLDERHVLLVGEYPGGDHDTIEVTVKRDNPDYDPEDHWSRKTSNISLCGMRHEEISKSEWNDAVVDYVFVCYDRHGMVNASPDEHALYAEIARALKPLGLKANNQGWKAFF